MINVFKYVATVALDHKKTESQSESVSNIKPLRNKYNCYGIKHTSKKEIGNDLNKIIQQLLLMFSISKKWKYVLLIFQKFTQIPKNQ